MATRTAWAQISQSIPKVLISTRRSSATAGPAAASRAMMVMPTMRLFITPLFQPKKVRDVHGNAHVLLYGSCVDPLIRRKEHTALDTDRLVKQQCRRAYEDGSGARTGRDAADMRGAAVLSGEL